jgi:hypothetical protein
LPTLRIPLHAAPVRLTRQSIAALSATAFPQFSHLLMQQFIVLTDKANQVTTRSEVFATKSDIESLRFATKSDIEGLRFSTKSDIESLRTEHQTLRADLVTKVAESERRTLDKIEAASLRHSNELNSFKSTLLFKIGLPVVVTIIAGFGTVITLLIKLLAKSAGLAA